MTRIADAQMGDVWPTARPGRDGADYGAVSLSPEGAFAVRSFQTFTLIYTVGEYGLDDTGAIKIVQRWAADGGALQCDDPAAPNHVTATASNGVRLEIHIEPYPHQRPWYNGVRITVLRGFMEPGDTITVVYGDRSGGSPGYRLQTFCERRFEFLVLADPCATGVFLPVGAPAVEIVAGPAESWVVAAPTLRRPGERFAIGLRAEDRWGNATADRPARVRLGASGPVDGLPETVALPDGARGVRVDGLAIATEGVTRIEILSEDGDRLAESNPVVTRAGETAAYWGDLHGQSGETVGIDPLRDYVAFARDVAFLDVVGHQGNDFQITGAFWDEINSVAAEVDAPGRFVMLPGYEWSANTPLGGDHNVLFRYEGERIHRSSHALLEDRSDVETDARTLEELFAALKGVDCVVIAHVGGRPADMSRAEDARLRTAVEVHSDWGTFEWIMTDAFDYGYRVGLVCNSDGHKGAPGASHPGASEFGAYGGLTCFLTEDLSRDGVFRSLRRRRHYGTTGCRAHVDLDVRLGRGGMLYPEDPRISDRPPVAAESASMGDIAETAERAVEVAFTIHAPAPIERVDVLRGAETVETVRPYRAAELGQRVRVLWEGAEYRGRGRQTFWRGAIRAEGPSIARIATINAWNHERPIRQTGPHAVEIDAVTTGNFGGLDLWFADSTDGALAVETDLVSARLPLSEIGLEDRVIEAGGLGRRIRAFRLPARLETCDLTATVSVPLRTDGRDTPIWVRMTTEDGHRIWTSPVYVARRP
jgi:hypothetical protein